jgi:hypothetical protein
LYQWNIELSGATYQALHVFEVVLRNALDQQLRIWNPTQVDSTTGVSRLSEWLLDPAPLLQRVLRDDIPKATARAAAAAAARHRALTHDDVLPQLTLGAWRYLLPDRRLSKQYLWNAALHRSFPYRSRPEAHLVADVDALHRLRNRVAHLEPILDSRMADRHVTALRHVLRDIDPNVEQWFTSIQQITHVLRRRPRP